MRFSFEYIFSSSYILQWFISFLFLPRMWALTFEDIVQSRKEMRNTQTHSHFTYLNKKKFSLNINIMRKEKYFFVRIIEARGWIKFEWKLQRKLFYSTIPLNCKIRISPDDQTKLFAFLWAVVCWCVYVGSKLFFSQKFPTWAGEWALYVNCNLKLAIIKF